MVTNLGLAGVPFAGYDAGGFIGDASPNLYKRWISLGAFSPFFRGHSQINTKRSEPWSYGEEAEEVARNYISLRYRLMPYIYAAFAQASETGMPVARSLLLDYQDDPQVLALKFQNQYQFGPSFLVCPIESEKQLEEIYLPEGQWYDLHNDTALVGSQTHIVKCPTYRLPVFVKASSIVPMQSVTQHMDEKPSDVLTLHIYNGTQENDFVYYEDDGESFDYQNQMFYRQHIHFDPKTKTLAWSKAQGKYISQCTSLRIYWHGFDSLHSCTIEGRSVPLQKQDYVFIPPVSNFDPFYTEQDQTLCIKDLPYIEVPLRASAFEILYT
ncbi:MAG: glycoside hydrolase family 31 protein [Bdellovibrionota bacterium]